jgi:hypothetical protein
VDKEDVLVEDIGGVAVGSVAGADCCHLDKMDHNYLIGQEVVLVDEE